MPRPDGEALGAAHGGDGGGAAGRQRQSVAQNCTPGTKKTGRRRSGGKSTASQRRARGWRQGPTGSLTVSFQPR